MDFGKQIPDFLVLGLAGAEFLEVRRSRFLVAELGEILHHEHLGIAVIRIRAKGRFEARARFGIFCHLVKRNAKLRRSRGHGGIDFQPLLQNRCGFLIVVLAK